MFLGSNSERSWFESAQADAVRKVEAHSIIIGGILQFSLMVIVKFLLPTSSNCHLPQTG